MDVRPEPSFGHAATQFRGNLAADKLANGMEQSAHVFLGIMLPRGGEVLVNTFGNKKNVRRLLRFRLRYIKMSSPHLNNLIIVGCILTYSSVIFLGLDSTLTSTEVFPYICTARASLLMTGFSLAFGAMFSKTWRVHSIFTDVKLNKKVIKDYQLFFVVGFLLSLDFVIMITWQAIDPFFREIRHMEPYPQPNSEDIMIVPENESCNSSRMTTFVFVIYAYKGLLMAFGAFLAWETRHVSIPALNDSKYVGMSVYNVVLMCIMGAAISFVLSDQHEDVSFIIISLFIIFCTTATLCLVFVPKVVELRRNPQGSIDKRIRATLRPMSSKMRRDSSELEEKVREAKQQNQQWRKIIMERDNEMQSLLRQLGPAEERLHQPPLSVSNQEVSQLRREPPSGTETTDISSICSVTSSHDGEANATETPAPRRKSAICSNKIPSISVDDMPPPAPTLSMINENTYNGNEPPSLQIMQTSQSPKHYSSLHRDKASPHHSKPHLNNSSSSVRRRSSLCKTASPQVAHTGGGRRTSMPAQGQPRQPPTYVLQDELWMTQRNCRSRCILNYSPSDDEEVSMIHRSVSERRNGKIKGHDSKALKKPTPGHVQSTPNVLSNAVSEGEILDLAILPIFQKLLTDRHGAAIASCPNIAIKCDIVEYL